MEDKGFTLVELMVVVVIIGILVGIIIPIYNHVQDKAAISAHEANLRTIDEAIALYKSQFGYSPLETLGDNPSVSLGVGAIDELIDKGFLSERPTVPKRLLRDPEMFEEPYSSLLRTLQEPFAIEAVYYEVQETGNANKAFPVLTTGKYRVGERPLNESQVYIDFLRTYVSGG